MSASPTVAPTFGLSWEAVGPNHGCCANSSGSLYSWVRHDGVTLAQCESLCVADPGCRGIETDERDGGVGTTTTTTTTSPNSLRCYLVLDNGTVAVNQSFTAESDAGSAVGPISQAVSGVACPRPSVTCLRVCRAGATTLAQNGCDGSPSSLNAGECLAFFHSAVHRGGGGHGWMDGWIDG